MKVGRTGEPWVRLEGLRCEYKGERVLMAFMTRPLDNVVLVEARAHQLLQAFRVDGEWFSVSEHDAEAAIRQAMKDVRSGWRFPAIFVRSGVPRHRDALMMDVPATRRRA